jgi:hypothetical protein
LVLPDGRIEAEVRIAGDRKPMKRATPGFMTVPSTGAYADYFTVYTYFGHHVQGASGKWRAVGTNTLTRAVSLSEQEFRLPTIFEDGWQARSGLYRLSTRPAPGSR